MSVNEIPYGVYDIEIGESFTTRPSANDDSADGHFHTLKYDFKPKSAASEQETYVSIAENKDVQVVVPNESLDHMTVYKGSMKPIKGDKECMLILDHDRNKLRLEKLSSNISLKKTRDNIADDEDTIKERIKEMRLRRKPRARNGSRDALAEPPSSLLDGIGGNALPEDAPSAGRRAEGGRTTSFSGILAAELASSPSAHSSGSSSSSSSSDSSNSDSESSSDDENGRQRTSTATAATDDQKPGTTASEHESDDDEHVQAIEKLMSQSSSQQPPTGGSDSSGRHSTVSMALDDTLAANNASSVVLDDLYMSDASGSESD